MKTKNKQYHKQLSDAFFEKDGKSSAIPLIIETIEEQLQKKDKINFLDIGCNRGTLYSILEIIINENGWTNKINFFGIDYDNNSTKLCLEKHPDVKIYNVDLNQDDINIEEHFDIITSINTIHEVFSGTLLKQDKNTNNAFEIAKSKTKKVLSKISNLLNNDSSLIIYDGLDIEEFQKKNIVRFSFVNSSDEELLYKFVKEYKPLEINIEKIGENKFETTENNFLRLVSTFKYLNTPIWDIERMQTYHYFSTSDFLDVAKLNKLKVIETIPFSNNIELWKSKFKLYNTSWPEKSILIKYNN